MTTLEKPKPQSLWEVKEKFRDPKFGLNAFKKIIKKDPSLLHTIDGMENMLLDYAKMFDRTNIIKFLERRLGIDKKQNGLHTPQADTLGLHTYKPIHSHKHTRTAFLSSQTGSTNEPEPVSLYELTEKFRDKNYTVEQLAAALEKSPELLHASNGMNKSLDCYAKMHGRPDLALFLTLRLLGENFRNHSYKPADLEAVLKESPDLLHAKDKLGFSLLHFAEIHGRDDLTKVLTAPKDSSVTVATIAKKQLQSTYSTHREPEFAKRQPQRCQTGFSTRHHLTHRLHKPVTTSVITRS